MMDKTPDTVSIPLYTARKLIKSLEEYVGDFSCDHAIDLCFCDERECLAVLRKAVGEEEPVTEEFYDL